MALALPVHVTEPAWRAIRDEVIGPARAGASAGAAPAAAGLNRLADAWAQPQPEAGRLAVWLDPELAGVLAALLDERPELAGHLGAGPAR
jgi:hypothetical protein